MIKVNCFLPGTEILTKTGWVDLENLSELQEVWQVDPVTLIGSWTMPKYLTSRHYQGTAFGIGGARGELMITEDHRLAWYGAKIQKHKYLETIPANIEFHQKRRSIAHATYCLDRQSSHAEEDIWIACMIQADGSKLPQEDKWSLGFRKQRKIDKCRELTKQSGIPYEYMHSFRIHYKSTLLCPKSKTLRLESLSVQHAATLLAAISFWDGYRVKTKGLRIEYTSVNKENVDQLMAYLVRCGYCVSIRNYSGYWRLYITDNLYSSYKKEVHKRSFYYDGMVYCLGVHTGHVLVRSGGRCWVVGQCQQLPKHEGVLSSFKPAPGKSLIDLDFSAVEPTIAATFSNDPTMIELYASGKTHDLYLFNAAKCEGDPELIRTYNLENPTKDSIATAKKQFKKLRDRYKFVSLSAQYGAGAWKMYTGMKAQGVDITLEETQEIYDKYWSLYSGLKKWEKRLLRERSDRGGWILNGRGLPLCVPDHRVKDIMNMFCQSTGHQLLLTFVNNINVLRHVHKVDMRPWLVNMHDQTIWEVAEAHKEAALAVFRDALAMLNAELKSDIPIKGEACVGYNLWEFKK